MPSKLRFFPITIFFSLPGTFLITYILSTALKHVNPIIPSISDTGSQDPESCFFSMFLNLTVGMMLFVIYVRHKQISAFFKAKNLNESKKYVSLVNLIASITGMLACVGLDVMANFQINHLSAVHDGGLYICLWCSSLYIFLQTAISFWMSPEMTSLWLVAVRGLLGVITISFIVITLIMESLGQKELFDDLGFINKTDILHWDETQAGWVKHIISGVSQWVTVISIGSFILTYYVDFKRVSIFPPELVMHADPVPKPVENLSFKTLNFVYK